MANINVNRLINPPAAASRDMRAYMQAMLEVTGLMAGESFPLEVFMGNYRTHLKPKENYPHACLTKDSFGKYSLTAEGVHFFSSRLTEEPVIPTQRVSRPEVVDMIRAIVSSQPESGWEQISFTPCT